MKNSHIKIPTEISFSAIVENDFILSPSQYRELETPNENFLYVKNFLSRRLLREDLGTEVGSLNYIRKSPNYFLRTKALQPHSFLPDITTETALPIMPNSFVEMGLEKGDLIISKDSNIGEIVILDKDYLNYMLSGALYKLPIQKNKYYLLAFIKHRIFREQLDFMVPRGATIRHAKTKFLDCRIPMPNYNTEDTIKFIELLTQAIINKELFIKQRHKTISQLIESELFDNQKSDLFNFESPTIKEIETTGRLDAGIYTEQFKQIEFCVKNYRGCFFYLDADKIKSGSTPNIRYIGNMEQLEYRWVTPSHCSDYGTLTEERINLQIRNNINEDCILLINRTSKGGVGEYVGIAGYYNFNDFGRGHHNQGMYRLINYKKHKLLFILSFLNCALMRKYCSGLSIGSKMKELKTDHFLKIPFPNFSEKKQKEIALLYHNPKSIYQTDTFTLANFLEQDNTFNQTAGIYELDKTAKQVKEILNKSIDNIVNDKEVILSFSNT